MMFTTKRSRSAAMRAGVALASTVAGLAAAGSALAQEVVVQGNRRVDVETVRSYVVGGAGSLEEARRALLASGLFSDVRIARRGAQIVVTVVENNTINRVAFEGNSKVEKATLDGRGPDPRAGPREPGADRRRHRPHP